METLSGNFNEGKEFVAQSEIYEMTATDRSFDGNDEREDEMISSFVVHVPENNDNGECDVDKAFEQKVCFLN